MTSTSGSASSATRGRGDAEKGRLPRRVPASTVFGSPYLSLVVVTMIWGALHPLGKLAMRDVTPIQLVLARVVFAAIVLTLLLATRGQAGQIIHELRTRPKTLAVLGACSFFGSSGPSMIALSLLPASVSSLLSNTSPLFVALGIIALSRGRTRADAVLGILVGFVGLAVVVFGESPTGFGQLALSPLGVVLSLLGSVTWALYIGLGRQAMARGNGLAVVVASAGFGGLPWLIVAAVHGDLARYLSLAPADWALLLFLGAVGTGLTYGLWTAALARLSAASVAVFQYAIPFWAVVLSVTLLGERVTVPLVVGGLGIVGGIALTQRATRRATRPARTAAASSRA